MAEQAVSPEKGAEDVTVQFKDQADVVAALKADPALVKEFFEDEQAFIKKYVNVEPTPEPAKEPEGGAPASVPPVEDEEVTVKFRKSQLGTYKPDADVISKGMREKDTTIEFFKNKKVPELETNLSRAQAETVSLKKQIEEFKKQQATKPTAAPTINATELDSLDPLDPEYAKKLATVLKASIDANAQLRGEIEEIRTGIKTEKDDLQTRTVEEQQRKAVTDELNELDIVRKLNPDLFTSSRPVSVIEDDYVEAVKGMCAVSGMKEPVMDATGRFTEAARQVFAKYHDESGKDLKAACDKQGIKLPDDFNDLKNTWEVKTLRDSYAVKDSTGQYKPIPFAEAVERFKAKSIDPQKIRMDALKDGHDAHAKAVQNRQAFAKETKPSEGAPPIDGSKLTLLDVRPMLDSYYTMRRDGTLTETDTAKITQVLRSIPGMDDRSLAEILKG